MARWTDEIGTLFAKIPHPLTVVTIMAEALMELVMNLKDFRDRVKRIEQMTEIASQADASLRDCRPLALEVGLTTGHHAMHRLGVERSRFQFRFALQNLESKSSPFCHGTTRIKLAGAA